MHGYGIIQRLRQISGEMLEVEQGALYPALYRIEQQGWISSKWGVSETGRKAKFYTLTRAGRKQLAVEEESWSSLALATSTFPGTYEPSPFFRNAIASRIASASGRRGCTTPSTTVTSDCVVATAGFSSARAGPLWWPVSQVCASGRLDWTEVPAPGQDPAALKYPAARLELLPAGGATGHAH